jgi:hypothetical protein
VCVFFVTLSFQRLGRASVRRAKLTRIFALCVTRLVSSCAATPAFLFFTCIVWYGFCLFLFSWLTPSRKDPPLHHIPRGSWSCPKCLQKSSRALRNPTRSTRATKVNYADDGMGDALRNPTRSTRKVKRLLIVVVVCPEIVFFCKKRL